MKVQLVSSEVFNFSSHKNSETYDFVEALLQEVCPGTLLDVREKGHRSWSEIVHQLKAIKKSDFDLHPEAILFSTSSAGKYVCGVSVSHLMRDNNLFSAQSCGQCLGSGKDVWIGAYSFLDDYMSEGETAYAPAICLTVWTGEEKEINSELLGL